MQPVDGRELLRKIAQREPAPPVLLMTAYGTIDQAVAAMREGAVDYLVKPFEAEELEQRVARYLRPAASPGTQPGGRPGVVPVAEDPKSRKLLDLAARVAQSEVTVLLERARAARVRRSTRASFTRARNAARARSSP